MVRAMEAAPHIPVPTIPFAHWSMRVARDAARDEAAWGQIVHQLADLEQGIANLLLTPKGSVPTNPEKGSNLLKFMDRPPAVAIPLLTVDLWEALQPRFLPRIRVEGVRVDPVSEPNAPLTAFRVPIFWRPIDGVVEDLVESRLEIADGRGRLADAFGAGSAGAASGASLDGLILQ